MKNRGRQGVVLDCGRQQPNAPSASKIGKAEAIKDIWGTIEENVVRTVYWILNIWWFLFYFIWSADVVNSRILSWEMHTEIFCGELMMNIA